MKKKLLLLSFCSVVLLLSVDSCRNDKEPVPITPVTCDSNPSTYSKDIKGIMDSKCVVCHKPGGSFASLPLQTYSQVKTATDSGKLVGTVKHTAGFPAMPQGGSKLSDAELALIDCWIQKGFIK